MPETPALQDVGQASDSSPQTQAVLLQVLLAIVCVCVSAIWFLIQQVLRVPEASMLEDASA